MKFQSTIVAAALAVTGMNSVNAFALSVSLQIRQKVGANGSMLNMVATTEIVDDVDGLDEVIRPRKTRKVSSSN
jgi:hypothetical protein